MNAVRPLGAKFLARSETVLKFKFLILQHIHHHSVLICEALVLHRTP